MIEPIDKALTIAGVDLVFPTFTIRGLPGFNVSVLYKQEVSVYEVEKQNFVFQISSLAARINNILIDNEFYMIETNANVKFIFNLDKNPMSDLTGWSTLNCNLISKVNL